MSASVSCLLCVVPLQCAGVSWCVRSITSEMLLQSRWACHVDGTSDQFECSLSSSTVAVSVFRINLYDVSCNEHELRWN
jgi:hypothetical protein